MCVFESGLVEPVIFFYTISLQKTELSFVSAIGGAVEDSHWCYCYCSSNETTDL